nr:hypothetical protein [Saprospiraceae bacterium]
MKRLLSESFGENEDLFFLAPYNEKIKIRASAKDKLCVAENQKSPAGLLRGSVLVLFGCYLMAVPTICAHFSNSWSSPLS